MTKTISIIDDHNTLLNTLSLQFQIHNYKTLTFECPLKALEYHSKYPADGYIIDMKMPKLTGFEFYQNLCAVLNKKSGNSDSISSALSIFSCKLFISIYAWIVEWNTLKNLLPNDSERLV